MLLWNKLIFLCFAPTTCFTDFTDALVWRRLAWPVPTPAPNDRGTPSQHRPVIGDHLIGATPFALAAKFAEGEIMRTLAAAGADGVLPLRNGWTPLMLASGASWRYGVWDRRDRALHRDFAFQAEHIDAESVVRGLTLRPRFGIMVHEFDRDLPALPRPRGLHRAP